MKKIMLHANESWSNIPEEFLEKFIERIRTLDFQTYPDMDSLKLREAYGAYLGVPVDNIIAGNGSDELLGMLIGNYLGEGGFLFTLNPDFSMYDFYAAAYKGGVKGFKVREDLTWDVDEFIEAGKKEGPSLILFSNPNNPTGQLASIEDLVKIIEAFPDIPVAIDEAYVEFCDGTIIGEVKNYDNLVVLRTLSKAFGLASIRVGFLIASDKIIGELQRMKVPYNVSAMGQIMGEIALESRGKALKASKVTISERERMWKEIQSMKLSGLKIFPSHTNFFYGRGRAKEDLVSALAIEDIFIREYKGDSFRITIGSPAVNDKLLRIINEKGEGQWGREFPKVIGRH